MKPLKVPISPIRLVMFFSYLVIILLAFMGGIITGLGEAGDARPITEQKIESLIKASGLASVLSSSNTNIVLLADKSTSFLVSRREIRAVYLFQHRKLVPFLKKRGGDAGDAHLSETIRKNLWQEGIRDKITEDKTNGQQLFYVRLLSKDGQKLLAILILRRRGALFSPTLIGERLQRAWQAALGSGRWVLATMVLLLAMNLFVAFAITAFWVVRPVRQFAKLLDYWDQPGFEYGSYKGFLRYTLLHVVELVERSRILGGGTTPKKEETLEQLLPVKRGFNLSGINTGAFLVRGLEEKKDYYDIFSKNRHQHVIFLGEVSGHGHQTSMTLARFYWAVRAYSMSFSNPAMVISELNKLFKVENNLTGFNLFLGFLDLREGVLTFSQAGGLSLYRFFPEAGKTRKYHLDILPAGLIDQELYKEQLTFARLSPGPGEVFGLFSDGILKLEGFDWERAAENSLTGRANIGEKVIGFHRIVEEQARQAGMRDDVAGLFFEVQ